MQWCSGGHAKYQNIKSNFGAKKEHEALKCSKNEDEGDYCCKYAEGEC